VHGSLQHCVYETGSAFQHQCLSDRCCFHIIESDFRKRRFHVLRIAELEEVRPMWQGNVEPSVSFGTLARTRALCRSWASGAGIARNRTRRRLSPRAMKAGDFRHS
jgi:hypothetical protein